MQRKERKYQHKARLFFTETWYSGVREACTKAPYARCLTTAHDKLWLEGRSMRQPAPLLRDNSNTSRNLLQNRKSSWAQRERHETSPNQAWAQGRNVCAWPKRRQPLQRDIYRALYHAKTAVSERKTYKRSGNDNIKVFEEVSCTPAGLYKSSQDLLIIRFGNQK